MEKIVDNPQRWATPLGADRGLSGQIAAQLRRAIIEGQLSPGQKINEETMSEAFATSRTPVREALRMLEAEGLVVVMPRRGVWVSQLVPEEAADVHLCRAYLLGLAAKLAASRKDDEVLSEIDRLMAALREFTEGDRWLDYVAVMAAINDQIVQASGSAHIMEALRPLNAKAQRYRHISATLFRRREDSLRNYENVVEAIRTGRGTDAENLMRNAVAEAGEALLKHLLHDRAAEDVTIRGYL
jgi:DNA-binding GntR family transcriptional regulator